MYLAITKITLNLPGVNNLKAKRRIVKSLCERISARFNVSIAEVGQHDKWQMAEIGVALVNNDSKKAQSLNNRVYQFILDNARDFVVLDYQQEIITGM